jgi:hypothetical protein
VEQAVVLAIEDEVAGNGKPGLVGLRDLELPGNLPCGRIDCVDHTEEVDAIDILNSA